MAATQTSLPPRAAHTLPDSSRSTPTLRANRGESLPSSRVGYLRPTAADTPREELQKRFLEDGYLFIKGLLPRQSVLDMRSAYFSHMACTGLLKPGTTAEEGIFDSVSQDPLQHSGVGGSDLPGDQLKVQKLTEAHRLDIYERFLAQDALRSWIREFMGWASEVMVVRNMLRHNVPGGLSTGIHYDRIFLRAGEAEFLTAWIPIGDCAANGGGLTYLEDSTALGRAMEEDFMVRAAAASMPHDQRLSGFNANMARDGQLAHSFAAFDVECAAKFKHAPLTGKWLVADYEAGDVVFHNPYMVHGSCRNEDPLQRIRLSSDVRFYEAGAPKDERWMNYWEPDDGL